MKKLIPILLGLLWASPALAQNPQCPTRPLGDSSNACASTAFVQNSVVNILTLNNTFTGFNTFAPLTATSPAVTINPLAASLGTGLVTVQSSAGSYSSGVSGDLTFFNGFVNSPWNVRDTTAGAYSTFGNLGSQLIVNGTNAYAPNGVFAIIGDIQTFTIAPASVGTTNQFSAILGRAVARTSPPAGVTGFGMNGLNGNVAIGTGVNGVAQVSAIEGDVTSAGGAPRSKFGFALYLGPLDLTQGSVNDSAFYLAVAAGTTPGWHGLFLLDPTAGTLFDTGACLMCVKGTPTIAKAFDFTGWTFSGNVWTSTGIAITNAGDVRIATAGSTSTSAVTVGGTQTLTNKTLTSPTIGTGATFNFGAANNLVMGLGGSFNVISFNGNLAFASMTGLGGGTDSTNLYMNAPTGGALHFRINASDIATAAATGFDVAAGNLTVAAGTVTATGYVAGASTGQTVTTTVRASGGAADCTLAFTGGLKTGGSC